MLKSVRQLKRQLGSDDSVVIHLTLIPYLAAAGELKTKPTQHSVQKLLEAGVQPDILVCRTEHKLSPEVRKKISLFCNVNLNAVIESIDVKTIYEVPLGHGQSETGPRGAVQAQIAFQPRRGSGKMA